MNSALQKMSHDIHKGSWHRSFGV